MLATGNAIRNGFQQLRSLLQKEREDFEKNFKKKEKQIEMIIQNSLHISGSIEGIAGQDSIDMHLQDTADEKFIGKLIINVCAIKKICFAVMELLLKLQ